jgi:SNF2 family DNA or RNA helicase
MSHRDPFLYDILARFDEVKLKREQMHGYQGEAYNFLRDNRFSGLFIDMGLGKTVSAGTLIADIVHGLLDGEELADGEKVLVIGPLRVATATWPNEFDKWEHLASMNYKVVHVDDDDPRLKQAYKAAWADGLERQMFTSERQKYANTAQAACKERLRQEAATDKATVHFISRDWIEWLVQFYLKRGKGWPYRCVIIDESSAFKDHNTNRFKALQSVVDFPGNVTRCHILTATPAAESYMNLFSQIYLLDKGKRLGKELSMYQRRYFTENKYTRKWELRPDGEKDILAKIADICLVMKREDYLPMVPPRFIERPVYMTPDQMALYRKMEKDMVVTLADGTEVAAESAAALSAKLLQMASGVLYNTTMEPGLEEEDDHAKVLKIHRIHEHKIEMLKEIVDEAQGKPILLGYHHRSSKERLKKAFPNLVFMDKTGKCIKKWNKGQIPILAMHPASGGHGLNLQDGGHIVVFFDIPWSLELYQQFIGRLDRQGQLERVTVFHIVCKGTLDEAVIEALTAKDDAQMMLFNILRRMRKKLVKLMKDAKGKAMDFDTRVEALLADEVL